MLHYEIIGDEEDPWVKTFFTSFILFLVLRICTNIYTMMYTCYWLIVLQWAYALSCKFNMWPSTQFLPWWSYVFKHTSSFVYEQPNKWWPVPWVQKADVKLVITVLTNLLMSLISSSLLLISDCLWISNQWSHLPCNLLPHWLPLHIHIPQEKMMLEWRSVGNNEWNKITWW